MPVTKKPVSYIVSVCTDNDGQSSARKIGAVFTTSNPCYFSVKVSLWPASMSRDSIFIVSPGEDDRFDFDRDVIASAKRVQSHTVSCGEERGEHEKPFYHRIGVVDQIDVASVLDPEGGTRKVGVLNLDFIPAGGCSSLLLVQWNADSQQKPSTH